MTTKTLKMFNQVIRRGSGTNLNLFRYAAMVLVLLTLGITNAWGGGHSTHYGKAVLQNQTGHGTVYLSTASGSNSGQSGSTTPGEVGGQSWITWNCGGSSSSDTKTYYARGTGEDGWYFAGWSDNSNATSYTASTTGKTFTKATSTNKNSPTTSTIYGFFKPVTVTAAPSNVNINATDPSATYNDAAGTVISFTTANSNKIGDFTTSESGDSRWVISAWTRASASSATFNYKFVGNGSYGTNNRTFTKTVTLTSKGDASSTKTCTLTAKYPNPKVVECNEGATDLTIYPTFSAADATQAAVEKTAVFDVVYADNANNFSAAFSGATGSGTWTVSSITVDQANQKATVTYTFNGNKSVGTHTAVLTLTAANCQGWDDTSAAGGASATVTLTAENTQEATNDASVTTTANVTTEYATFAAALTAANATSGATLKLLRNVDLGTITTTNNITKAMTIDLNGKELRAAVNATSVGILNVNAAVAVTIKDSKTGGKIINEIARNAEIRAITVTKGTLTLESGTITVHNTGQYASAANADLGVTAYASCQCRTIHQAAGTTVNITGGRVEAYGTRSVYGILQASSAATNNAGTTVLNVSGGEIYAEGPYSIMGIYAYGKVNFSGGTINAHVNTNMIDARYAADNANNLYNGYGYGIYANVSSNATASSCYYATVEMTGGTINVTNDRTYSVDRRNYGILFNAGSTVVASGKTGADGTLTQKASATGSIDGGEINVTSGTQYSFGVYVLGDYNSYNNTHHTVQIKNCKITSKAYVYAYGVAAWSGFNGTNNGCYAGDVELTNCDVYAESLNTSTAAAVWVTATGGTLFKDDSNATKSRCYGEYAVAGKAVINSGKYEAKTKTTSAYAVGTSSRYKTTYDSETTVATNRKPGGNAEAYPTLIIHGGTFKATSTTTTARGVSNGGYCTIDGGTFEAFATTTTAHGLYCLTGKITASGATISASATGTAYGALADAGIPTGNTAQTGFAYAGELELNNCDITATTRTSTEARGVYVFATNKLHNWTTFHSDSASGKWAAATTAEYYRQVFPCTIEGRDSVGIAIAGKATINGCDIKVTAGTTTAYGVYSTATSVPASADASASPIVNIKNTKFTVKTDGTTTAYGVYAGGPTTIDGCDFTVLPKTTTAYGVYAYDKKTTITNTKFDVKGTNTVYGLYANAAIGSTTGWDYHGEFELGEGNDLTAAATGGNTSHVLTLIAAKRNVASGRFIGDYANAALAHITGGAYKATATGTTSYVLNLSAQQVQGSAVSQPSCTIEGGKFWALASGGTTGVCTTNGVAGNILFKGGVYNVNTTLSKHIPEGYEEVPLASDRPEYTEGYRYEVGEAGMHGIDVCQIGSTKYKTLEEALQVVTSGQTIYMIANYIMNTPGDYILPSGATLLIPYKDGTGKGASTAIGNSAVTNSSATTPSLFRKLTFGNGVNLTCFGTIETSAQQRCNGQYGACAGMPSGAYGQIHMEEGSHISLEANSRLNCWGYITGKGTINVKKNATVLEDFQLGDWPGGTNAGNLEGNSQKVFPITHYFYQNIECPITYRPGCRALGSTHIYASSTVAGQDAVALVGTSGSMFLMDDNDVSAETWVMKDYDEETDQCIWTINSGASIGNLNITMSAGWISYDFSSSAYDLPITTNMSIVLNYGAMGITQNTVFLPGSELVINKQGTANINGVYVVAYDVADWTGTTRYFATYSPTWGTTNPRKNIAVKSADFFLHGKVNITNNGGLYTTASGANIHSTNADAGEVIYTTAAQGNKTNHYYLQQGGTTKTNITIYPAKLKNTDGSYASSAGTTSGKTWTFKNDIWDAWSKDGCFFMNAQDKPHAKPAALVELTGKTPDANHLHHDAATGLRNFVWDADCYWWEVVTTPTAEGYYRSINADNNGDYNYYYYDSSAACWKIKKITITWNVNGTNTNYSVGYGTKPEWLGATPTKNSSSSNYVWRWDGWTMGSDPTVLANNDLPYVTENTTFTAHFYEKYYEYNVTFKNSDGTILDSRNWRAGTTPSYEGTPTKNPTAAETYEFNGTWTPAIATVTASATYVANYTATPRKYTITFLNYDMSVLGTAEVVYNGTPSNATYLAAVAPLTEDPYKPDNSAFSFEFAGWRLQGASSNGFAQVKGDQTYIAQFNQTTKKYKVSFVDDDETLLHWTQLEYGQTPSYTWDAPANKQDVEWNYTFTGWDPSEFAVVESAQTYTAVYNKTKREYTITWVDGNGATMKTDQVAYGETPAYSGATPQKASTSDHSYEFNNTWLPAIVAVTGEATYTAQFNETERKYRVTWDAATNDGTCATEYTDFSYNAAIGTLPVATKEGHTFNGWFTQATGGTQITTATKVTADVTYHAQFTVNPYTITFDSNGGSAVASITQNYGTAVTAPANPTREGYTFNGWSPAVPSTMLVNGLTCVAQWTVNPYTITFDSNGGSSVASITQNYGTAVTAPADPTREGYTFDGWSPSVPSTMPVNGLICVAQWTVNPYTITFDSNGGSSVASITQNYGTAVTAPANPTREGYTFNGWSPAVPSTMPVNGLTCVAQWTINSYQINFVDEDGTTNLGSYPQTLDYGTAVTAPEEPTKAADATNVYTFAGWSDGVSTYASADIPAVSGAVTYTATYNPAPTVASVTVGGATTYYATLQAAFDYAADKTEPTIKVLADIALAAKVTFTGAKATTITFDLNGYKVSGAVNQLFYFTGSKAFTFKIQDSSVGQTGQIYNKLSSNAAISCVYVYYGTVELYSGTIYMQNTSTSSSVQAYGVLVRSGVNYKFNMKGGKIEVHSTKRAYGIYTQGTTTVTDGTIIVTETRNGYAAGVHVLSGTTTISDNPTFTISGTNYVNGVRVGGLTPKINSKKTAVTQYNGVANIEGGTYTVRASSSTAYGVYCYGSTYKVDYATSSTLAGNYADAGTANVRGGVFEVTSSGATAYGVCLQAPTSIQTALDEGGNATYDAATTQPKANITGGKFNVSGTSEAGAVNTAAANTDLIVEGGWYNINTNLDGYTAPNYHVLDLADEDPYKYEVAEAYTVTFAVNNADYGSVNVNSITVPKNTTVSEDLFTHDLTIAGTTITPTPAFTDAQYTYDFVQWNNKQATITGAVTIEAQFSRTARTYGITLHSNEGTVNDAAPDTYTYGVGAKLPADVTRDGYAFAGWYADEGLTGSAVTDVSDSETGEKQFYAKWIRALDIIDWTSNSLTINGNGLKSADGTTNWQICIQGIQDQTKTKSDRNATTRKLTFDDLNLTPGGTILIQTKNSGIVESWAHYKVPYIYTSTQNMPKRAAGDIVYVYGEGTQLTIDASQTAGLAALYVGPGAVVTVTNGTLSVGKLVLRTKPWSTAAINGSVEATKAYYTRIGPDGSEGYAAGQYYQFGLPLACAINDVTLSDGTKPVYKSTWMLKSYNEASRASSSPEGDNWVALTAEGTIAAGAGYEMFSSMNYYREYYFPVDLGALTTEVPVQCSEGDKQNAGWNIICSPLLGIYTNESYPEGLRISWMLADGFSSQEPAETIHPAMPFSYQSEGTGSISFAAKSAAFQASAAAPAPRRRMTSREEPVRIQWMHLDIKDAKGVGDQTSIYSHPTRYDESYKTGIDIAKQSLTASRAILYSTHAYGDMAFAGVADSLLEQGVALTVYSPKAQELTISMRENDWLNRLAYVWLVDHETGARTDLLWSDYTFDAAAGTTSGRFTIEGVFYAPQVATDIENGELMNGEMMKARKVIIEEKMYIIVNGRMFDANGKLVK